MSLEQLLKENTEATLAQNELLSKLLSATAGGAASKSPATTESSDEEPKRERGKPSPGKSKRTAAEVAEDKAADEADAAAAAGSDDGGDETSNEGPTFDSVKDKLAAWLGEFAKPEDKEKPEGTHPEVDARKAALKAVLNKLTGTDDGKLGAISKDNEKIAKLDNWFETKAKVADKGHGVGRLAADPEETGESDDDLDI